MIDRYICLAGALRSGFFMRSDGTPGPEHGNSRQGVPTQSRLTLLRHAGPLPAAHKAAEGRGSAGDGEEKALFGFSQPHLPGQRARSQAAKPPGFSRWLARMPAQSRVRFAVSSIGSVLAFAGVFETRLQPVIAFAIRRRLLAQTVSNDDPRRCARSPWSASRLAQGFAPARRAAFRST